MKSIYAATAFFACGLAASPAGSGPALKDVIAKLDQAASQFRGMSAEITRTKHTEVINDDSTEKGVVYMGRGPRGSLLGLMKITTPDPKSYALEGHTVRIYLPKENQVEVYDAGKNGDLLEQFLTLGFGTSGHDLEKTYTMQVLGTETVDGDSAVHLQLVPKSSEGQKIVKEIDLWISQSRNYPVQERILEPSGDYHMSSYRDVRINPKLTEDDLKLKLPAGVKQVHPQH